MNHRKIIAAIGLAFTLFLCTLPAYADNQTPTSLVQNFYAQLTDTMKHGEHLGFAGRYKKLAPVIQSTFNLPLMTRFAVGSAWASAKPEEQEQLISAFSDLSIATYANRFTKYDGEKFEVLSEAPASNGGVIVATRLTPNGGDPVALNYLVRNDDKNQPRIVDVLLDSSISELATRRSEFSSIVRNDGLGALVTTLSEKSKKLGPS